MRTDDLIELLSTNVEPVDHRQTVHNIRIAIAVGIAAALTIVLLILGPRADFTSLGTWLPAIFKIAATIVILLPASAYLITLSRPGGEHKTSMIFVALPFIAVIVLTALSLASAPSEHWKAAILSDEWLECVISIPLIAIVPFAVITWVVRQMAPTDLARTGALVGLVAGCVSAIGYAFHCADDSVPFFALWYGATIALCTFAGWRLGPKLLRW